MTTRRSFLAALCALPFLRWVRGPKPLNVVALGDSITFGLQPGMESFSWSAAEAEAFRSNCRHLDRRMVIDWTERGVWVNGERVAPPPGQGT